VCLIGSPVRTVWLGAPWCDRFVCHPSATPGQKARLAPMMLDVRGYAAALRDPSGGLAGEPGPAAAISQKAENLGRISTGS
jgi:hypothetical protein